MSTLQEELDAFKAEILANTDQSVIQNIVKQTNELTVNKLVEKAVKKGDKAPEFKLEDVDGSVFDSATVLGSGKNLVVSFFKGGWCPYCNIELKRLQRNLSSFESLNAELVAISPQIPEMSKSTAQQNETTFHVLSDVDNVVAKQFGLVFALAEELRPVYTDVWKMDVPSANGNDKFELPVPATYVIGADGTVLFSFVDVDYTQRAEPDKIIAALEEASTK